MSSFNNITVILAKHEIDNLIKAEVQKSFPNHVVQSIKFSAEGTAEISLKLSTSMNGYWDR